MQIIRIFEMLMTVLAIACVAAGVAILAGYLDVAALTDLPSTFNNPCAITLIVTGIWVLVIPYLPKYRKKKIN